LALIVIVPLFGVLIYLIARGDKMKLHEILADRHHYALFHQYVRSAAGTPPAVVVQLEDLRDRGVLTDDEFQRAKQRAIDRATS
jgi:hypothetical protein